MTTNDYPKQNTDRELWRESDDRSQCTPSIHVTQDGGIGINVGGTVIVRPIREWHALAAGATNARRIANVADFMAEDDDEVPAPAATPQPIIAKPETPPFEPKQFVRIKSSGTILNVARCEKRVVHGASRWVVDGLNGMRAFASDCELIKNMELVNAETGQAVIHLPPAVRYACSKAAAVGDTVKFASSNRSVLFKVTALSPPNMCHLKSLDGKTGALCNAKSLEFVPEVTPLNGERATMFNPAAELEREQLRQQLAVAMSLLGQCDNRLFLVGDFEIRKAGGGWRIYCPPSKLALSADDVFEIFRDPVAAALRAKELSGVAKGGAA